MHSLLSKPLVALLGLQATAGIASPTWSNPQIRSEQRDTTLSVNFSLDWDPGYASSYANGVYFTNWGIYARDYAPSKLPASEITHVFYAFLNLLPNGTVFSGDVWADYQKPFDGDPTNRTGNNALGCVRQLYLLKQENRHLKTLLSIGGSTWSSNFASAVSTSASRANFAKSAITIMKDWGFDGIDIDWEYPADDTQASNFVLLLKAIRDGLDSYASKYASGHHFLLTAATSAGPQKYSILHLDEMSDVVDFFNLMAFDYAGSWNDTAAHQANLFPSLFDPDATPFSTLAPVRDYILSGVPPSKIHMGMPVYGRSFENTTSLGKSYDGVGAGSWEAGVWDYKVLPKDGATVFYDWAAGATYSYNDSTKELISFDTADMVQIKMEYAKWWGLGGAMFWEASADRTDDQSLIGRSSSTLGSLDTTENWLDYPQSQFKNIASGEA